ncbi:MULTISPECIES: hypothetical protein [Sedimenticola]|uniref:hypothetical protein n=1 Tax=Sedimenticola TaxID=349742 RepID=UPI0025879048|nr:MULTISPECIES: hypothetical protein [Sedimenticola]MCW8903063.1 hypothetical protein [Sedimenticola sp.]
MKRLINLFVDICLLRAAPQDLPVASFLVTFTLLLNLLTGTIVIVGHFNSVVPALLAQLMDLALLALLVRLALNYQRHAGRFTQAISALFGCGVLINLVAMPLQLMIGDDPRVSPLGGLGVLFYVMLVIWGMVVVAHILRHTFEIRFGNGMLLSIGYFMLINWLVELIFPRSS